MYHFTLALIVCLAHLTTIQSMNRSEESQEVKDLKTLEKEALGLQISVGAKLMRFAALKNTVHDATTLNPVQKEALLKKLRESEAVHKAAMKRAITITQTILPNINEQNKHEKIRQLHKEGDYLNQQGDESFERLQDQVEEVVTLRAKL